MSCGAFMQTIQSNSEESELKLTLAVTVYLTKQRYLQLKCDSEVLPGRLYNPLRNTQMSYKCHSARFPRVHEGSIPTCPSLYSPVALRALAGRTMARFSMVADEDEYKRLCSVGELEAV